MTQHRFSEEQFPAHLDDLPTDWTTVEQARRPASDPVARAAQERLLCRYERAIRSYLWGAVRDDEIVNELFQKLAARLAEGKFEPADRSRGRFRKYLKSVLYRMIIDDHRERQRRRAAGGVDGMDVADSTPPPGDLDDQRFARLWRDDLLEQAWRELAELERKTGRPYHTVLRLRAERDHSSNLELAEQLALKLGERPTEAKIASLVHAAREEYAERVIAAVARTLEHPSTDGIEEELIALNLHRHKMIRRLLDRRRGR